MQTPASRYTASTQPYRGLEDLIYPFHDWTAIITTCGRICYQRRKINVSQVFAGQKVGVKQVQEHIWLVTTSEMARRTGRFPQLAHPPSRLIVDMREQIIEVVEPYISGLRKRTSLRYTA